jgi:hypothetical protein
VYIITPQMDQDSIMKSRMDPVMNNRLPVQMNIIRIRIDRAEFLWSDFQKRGYAARQSCTF